MGLKGENLNSKDIDSIIKILKRHDKINSAIVDGFSEATKEICADFDADHAFNLTKAIVLNDYPIEVKGSAIGILFHLDGISAIKMLAGWYIHGNLENRTWICQMSARSASFCAARLLEGLLHLESDETERAEIIDSLGECGDLRTVRILESLIAWDDGFSWDGVRNSDIAKSAIEHIKIRRNL